MTNTFSEEHSARLRGDSRPEWWQVFAMSPVPAGYDEAVADTRDLLDAQTAAVSDEQLVAELRTTLRRLTDRLQRTAVDDYHQLAGRIDYRSITPVERPLTLAAEVMQEEGREIRVRGTLHDADVLCAEAEGLFVVLRPGQA